MLLHKYSLGAAFSAENNNTAHFSRHRPTRRTMGNAQPTKAELPDDADDAGAAATTPGGGLKSRASPNGGVLFKYDVPSEKYEVSAPNVTPELSDEGDDEHPRWILEVRERFTTVAPTTRRPRTPRSNPPDLHGRATPQICRPPKHGTPRKNFQIFAGGRRLLPRIGPVPPRLQPPGAQGRLLRAGFRRLRRSLPLAGGIRVVRG